MDDWGVDVVVGASQKGLMHAARSLLYRSRSQGIGSDEGMQDVPSIGRGVPASASSNTAELAARRLEHMIFGLREAIEIIDEEGLDNLFARHARLADAARLCVGEWAKGGALEFNALRPEERANGLTVIRVREDLDAEEIRRTARDMFDVACGGGLALLANKVFRIGHMGDINDPMILGALGGVESTLGYLGLPYESGLNAAAKHLAETALRLNRPADGRTYSHEAMTDTLRSTVKEKRANGEAVSSMTVRLVPSVEIVQVIKSARFDSFYIDPERRSPSRPNQIATTALAAGIDCFARVPANTPDYISRVLDGVAWASCTWCGVGGGSASRR